MYATVFKKSPLDPQLGQLYREKILRVGGSREETESLKVCPIQFLFLGMAS
jgi:Zn-dependent oligopeptidase